MCVCSSVHSSIRMYQHGYLWMDICETWYWGHFWRCQENSYLVKIGKNVWHFKSGCVYILLLVTTLNYYGSALFGWDSMRLLGMAEEVKALTRMSCIVTSCIYCVLVIYRHAITWLGLFSCKSLVTPLYYSGACGVGVGVIICTVFSFRIIFFEY